MMLDHLTQVSVASLPVATSSSDASPFLQAGKDWLAWVLVWRCPSCWSMPCIWAIAGAATSPAMMMGLLSTILSAPRIDNTHGRAIPS
jgi:hypothetical protein